MYLVVTDECVPDQHQANPQCGGAHEEDEPQAGGAGQHSWRAAAQHRDGQGVRGHLLPGAAGRV